MNKTIHDAIRRYLADGPRMTGQVATALKLESKRAYDEIRRLCHRGYVARLEDMGRIEWELTDKGRRWLEANK